MSRLRPRKSLVSVSVPPSSVLWRLAECLWSLTRVVSRLLVYTRCPHPAWLHTHYHVTEEVRHLGEDSRALVRVDTLWLLCFCLQGQEARRQGADHPNTPPSSRMSPVPISVIFMLAASTLGARHRSAPESPLRFWAALSTCHGRTCILDTWPGCSEGLTLWARAQCSLTLVWHSLWLTLDTARNLLQASHLNNKVVKIDCKNTLWIVIPEYPLAILSPYNLQSEGVVTMLDPVLHWWHGAGRSGEFQHFVTLKTFKRLDNIHIVMKEGD